MLSQHTIQTTSIAAGKDYLEALDEYGEGLWVAYNLAFQRGFELDKRRGEVLWAIIDFAEDPSANPIPYEGLKDLYRKAASSLSARQIPPKKYLCAALNMAGEVDYPG